MTHRLLLAVLLFATFACLNAHAQQLVINEYQCSNLSTVTDNYGNYDDWIELYNPTASAVSLTGYYLSDKPSDPTKWQFTSGSIAANGTALVFASGNDIIVGTYYHTNFTLKQTKPSKIILSDPSGQIIDSLTVQRHEPGHSWGRTTNGAIAWGVFTTPTPGASNNSQTPKTRYAAKPAYSLAAGFYSGAQTLTLTSTEIGANIYYTTDGSVPTTASTHYTAPISVSATTVIKAIAVAGDPNILPSFYEFNTYFINTNFTMPVVSLSGDQIETLMNGSQINPVTTIEYFETDHSEKFKAVGTANKHGNDSWAYNQRGIDYATFDQYGYASTMNYKVFPRTPRDKFQRLIFKAAASDNYPGNGLPSCHLRDALVQDYSQKIGLNIDARSLRHNILFVDGQYWGIYETREKVDDADYMKYYYNQGANDIDVLKYWGGLNIDYGSDTGWVSLYNYVMANSLAVPANYAYVSDRLAITNFIDYCIYNTYIVDTDWIDWNTMWLRGRNPLGSHRKWHYALWDEDNVFNLGQNFSGWQTTGPTADPCDLANNYANAGPQMGTFDILTALMQNPGFHQQYINRYADLMNGPLSCDSMLQHLQWFVNVLTPEMPAHIAKWGGSMAQWQTNVQGIHDFMTMRCSYIAGSLVNCYDVTGPYNLTVIVDPPGAGTVKVGTFTPQNYPYTGQYFGSSANFVNSMHLEEQVNPDYVFGYWIPGTSTIAPNILSDTLQLNLTGNDTIIAHFKYWPLVNDVQNVDGMSVAVFPTVTDNEVAIDFHDLPEPLTGCRVYDITGKEAMDATDAVKNLKTGRTVLSLKTAGLAGGMYYVELCAGSRKTTRKIVYQPD